MSVTSVLGLLAGAVLSAACVLTSGHHKIRFQVLKEGSLAATGTESSPTYVVVYEPCDRCRSVLKEGDAVWERRRWHPWLPVGWIRCKIEREGRVDEEYSSGGFAYVGVAASLAAIPALAGFLISAFRSPKRTAR